MIKVALNLVACLIPYLVPFLEPCLVSYLNEQKKVYIIFRSLEHDRF